MQSVAFSEIGDATIAVTLKCNNKTQVNQQNQPARNRVGVRIGNDKPPPPTHTHTQG